MKNKEIFDELEKVFNSLGELRDKVLNETDTEAYYRSERYIGTKLWGIMGQVYDVMKKTQEGAK